MKIALACKSILLEKSLEIFLQEYLTPYKKCDFVITDKHLEIDKPFFYVGTVDSDLNIPFSKSSLILSLEKFYNSLTEANSPQNLEVVKKVDIDELEGKITDLTDNFRKELINIIREYHEEE
jgi:hypothetical protein